MGGCRSAAAVTSMGWGAIIPIAVRARLLGGCRGAAAAMTTMAGVRSSAYNCKSASATLMQGHSCRQSLQVIR